MACGIFRGAQSRRRVQRAANFFIWIRHNPLKSPNSAKGIQGNPKLGGERGAYGTEKLQSPTPNHTLSYLCFIHRHFPLQLFFEQHWCSPYSAARK